MTARVARDERNGVVFREMRRASPVLLATFIGAIALMLARSRAASAGSADELVRMARSHEAANEEDVALRRYTEALSIDPTHEAAYLGLAALREKRGEPREAERTLAVALEHIPSSTEARLSRARLLWTAGRFEAAEQDARAVAARDLRALEELVLWNVREGWFPAALAWTRVLATQAAQRGDEARATLARESERALMGFIGDADPVSHPDRGHGAARSAIKRLSIALVAAQPATTKAR